jgi:glycosyltransferase involved in cell wall biosynthesis
VKSVAYIYPYSFHYRAPFNERLRERLASHGVQYDFIYSADPKLSSPRGDLVQLPWATSVPCSRFRLGRIELRYQHALRAALRHDLIILQQENGLLLNYLVVAVARMFGKRTAYFGHGKNFQARNPGSLQERFKRFWLDKVDWWFAYTELSAHVVADAGYPMDRITIFDNSIDTSAIRKEVEAVDATALEELRQALVGGSANVGVYVGGLYEEKRIPFLIEAVDGLRRAVPDFHFVVMGAGSQAHLIEEAARTRDWLHYLGPKFGPEKTLHVCLGKVLLMPGLVGLAILDSFAYERPLVTTHTGLHSPEIAYLKNGHNGVMVESDGVQAYVSAVERVMRDAPYRAALAKHGRASGERYTTEAMAQRFADGVIAALAME